MFEKSKMIAGAMSMARLVCKTMGPGGRIVAYDNGVECVATKDGVSVAHYYWHKCPVKMAGARMLRQAAAKSVSETGDGTTATIAIASEFIRARLTPRQIRETDNAIRRVSASIRGDKIGIADNLMSVAMVASNYDREISEGCVGAIKKNGRDGMYSIQESIAQGISVDYIQGFGFEGGIADQMFANQGPNCVAKNPIVYAAKDLEVKNVIELLNQAINDRRPIILIGKPDDELLSAFCANKNKAIIDGAIVVPQARGHILDNLMADLAAIIPGATEVIAGKHKVIIKHNADIAAHAESILAAEYKSEAERDENKERAAALQSKVAVLSVGAETTAALAERKARLDDCIKSTLSALDDGVVPGGGECLAKLAARESGILRRALLAPKHHIHRNASDEDLAAAVPEGIKLLDSAKVVKSALVNGWAAAKMFMSLGGAIIKAPKED